MGSAASPTPAASSAATEWCALRGADSLTRTGSLIRRHRVVRPPRGRQHHPHRQPHPPPQSGATSAGSAASPHRQPHPPPQSSAPPSGPAASLAHRRQHPHRLLPCTTPLPASITQAPVPDGHAAEMTAPRGAHYSITAGERRRTHGQDRPPTYRSQRGRTAEKKAATTTLTDAQDSLSSDTIQSVAHGHIPLPKLPAYRKKRRKTFFLRIYARFHPVSQKFPTFVAGQSAQRGWRVHFKEV